MLPSAAALSPEVPSPPAPRASMDEAGRLAAIIAVQNDLMASEPRLDVVLQMVAIKTQLLTQADGSVVELGEGESLVYRAATGSASGHLGARIPAANSLSGLCLQLERVLVCDDAETDPRVNRELCRQIGVRSMVVVPVRHRERTSGVLKVLSADPNAFGQSEVDTLQLMAGLIGAAIVRSEENELQRALIAERDAAVEGRERAFKEREAATLALEQSTLTLRRFFDAAPLLMTLVQREGDDFRYLALNRHVAALLGKTVDEVVGRLASELGAHRETLDDALRHCEITEKTGVPSSWDFTRGEGANLRHFSGSVCTLPGSTPEGPRRYCYITKDITERVQMAARADRNSRMASIGTLAAGVAHEANNPLSYVVANLRFIGDALSETPEAFPPDLGADLKRAVAEAREGAERVRLIIKDLYTFARAEAEPLLPLDLSEVIHRSMVLGRHGVEQQATVTRNLSPVRVSGSGARLSQVVINLLVNAAQAMPADRARDQNQISVSCGAVDAQRALLEVKDNGCGMAQEILPRIFEPFFTTRPIGSGVGLGLSVCHNIVEEHRGDFAVESSPGNGSTFRVLLPRLNDR